LETTISNSLTIPFANYHILLNYPRHAINSLLQDLDVGEAKKAQLQTDETFSPSTSPHSSSPQGREGSGVIPSVFFFGGRTAALAVPQAGAATRRKGSPIG